MPLCGLLHLTAAEDLIAVMKALQRVKAEIPKIFEILKVDDQKIKQIKATHRLNYDRVSISLIGEWLRGSCQEDYRTREPYSLHEEQYQHPSWWNLVWAVAHSVGGNNPAQAEKIAKTYPSLFIFPYYFNFSNNYKTLYCFTTSEYMKPEVTSTYDAASITPFSEY